MELHYLLLATALSLGLDNMAGVFGTIAVKLPLFANADLATNLGKVAGIMNAISMILFFAALLLAGVMFASGRTEAIKYGLVGAAIGGLSWLIVATMFSAASPVDPGIELRKF